MGPGGSACLFIRDCGPRESPPYSLQPALLLLVCVEEWVEEQEKSKTLCSRGQAKGFCSDDRIERERGKTHGTRILTQPQKRSSSSTIVSTAMPEDIVVALAQH